MALQRKHFLLSYLKTLSVGPAGAWTHDLPHDSPVLYHWANRLTSFLLPVICIAQKKKKKKVRVVNQNGSGMLKFTLQPGGQSDMVWCYSGLKIDECNLKSYNSRPKTDLSEVARFFKLVQ